VNLKEKAMYFYVLWVQWCALMMGIKPRTVKQSLPETGLRLVPKEEETKDESYN